MRTTDHDFWLGHGPAEDWRDAAWDRILDKGLAPCSECDILCDPDEEGTRTTEDKTEQNISVMCAACAKLDEGTLEEVTEPIEGYGDGSPPPVRYWIQSDTTGNGITAGHLYPVVSWHVYGFSVRNDNGHLRSFGTYSGTHAHCTHYDWRRPPRARVLRGVKL